MADELIRQASLSNGKAVLPEEIPGEQIEEEDDQTVYGDDQKFRAVLSIVRGNPSTLRTFPAGLTADLLFKPGTPSAKVASTLLQNTRLLTGI
jgi:hypothetical protein